MFSNILEISVEKNNILVLSLASVNTEINCWEILPSG